MQKLALVLVGLVGLSATASAAPLQGAQRSRDTTVRLNSLRKLGGVAGTRMGARTGPTYKPAAFQMSIPDNLGHAPTSADVSIQLGADGRSPAEAVAKARTMMRTPVLRENDAFVNQTLMDTHKAFTIAVNNVFTSGSPSNKLVGTMPGADVSILGVMSAVHPTVIMAKQPGEKLARFYAPTAGGGFEQLSSMPYSIIMRGRLQDGTKGGVRVNYTSWSNSALANKLTTITEQ